MCWKARKGAVRFRRKKCKDKRAHNHALPQFFVCLFLIDLVSFDCVVGVSGVQDSSASYFLSVSG